jgi:signal transduction histidine kinase
VSHAIKICVYRFIQEGLNNAFRHAGGIGQSVRCRCDSGSLLVSVRDRGAGGPHSAEEREVGLGLTGLRERVESLGGVLDIRPAAIGMTITMKISLPGGECNA